MTRAPDPLNPGEEALWRALAEVIMTLPRALDEQFLRDTGVTMTGPVFVRIAQAVRSQTASHAVSAGNSASGTGGTSGAALMSASVRRNCAG
jgi:hypothetical protein